MKYNWRLILTGIIILGVVTWAVRSVLPSSYDGVMLNFGVGSGVVAVNNPSDVSVPVKLTGTGTRSFTLSSNIEGVSGSSNRQGSGSTSTQVIDLNLPPGRTEFTVTRGTNVKFVSDSEAQLEAIVQPLSEGESRTTFIVAVVVLLGGLFYMSHTTGHQWIRNFRRQEVVAVPIVQTPEGDPNRGRDGRMYSNYGRKD